ncbi:NADP-dependent alcohol dehydrogenase [Mycena filopes]|nr:NADP-dependent alcohol dehydrogenase [Mycena filopes]
MGIDFTVFKGSPDGIVQATHHLDLPTGNEVLIKITHSGICGTDEHYRHSDLVLGHEGVGIIQEVGPDVKEFKIGEAVGWGYTHKTCGVCPQCLLGEDQYCRYREYYGVHNFHQGSFGSHAIWDASFVFHIPDGLALESAAPLMCGGASVFNVLETHNIRSTDRVGVVGIGGLGHLAVIFLAKMGASVVVFSSTESKREEAMKLGATEFYTTSGVEELAIGKPLDHLLVTTNSLPNWKLFLDVIKPRGSIYPMTVSSGSLDIPSFPVLVNGFTIQGLQMLEFAARHGVNPIIERFPMTKTGVEEGMAKLREGKMRYRGVLVA